MNDLSVCSDPYTQEYSYQITQKITYTKSLSSFCRPSASSLTNSGTGQFITEELGSLQRYQADQRRKDESIADLEELRYHKIMALCDEITQGNFDSGTG